MIKILIFSFIYSSSLLADDFVFSSHIKKSQEEIILNDLQYLKEFNFTESYPRTLEAFEVPAISGEVIYQWLNKRVNYFVDDKILSKTNVMLFESIYKESGYVDYPNENVIPYSLSRKKTPNSIGVYNMEVIDFSLHDFGLFSNKTNDSIMTNLGASLYLKGKIEKKMYVMKFSQSRFTKKEHVRVKSPRVGVLKISDGFFSNIVAIGSSNSKLPENIIARLSIIAHEARHSDGNSESLSFAHAICPKGHTYAGLPACDENLNGPYTIGAQLALEMLRSNPSMKTAVKTALKSVILDNLSRVVTITNSGETPKYWDTLPEEIQN